MKNHFALLFCAGALAWGLTGCASTSGRGPAATHTLKVDRPYALNLPMLLDDYTRMLLENVSVSRPVKDLGKIEVLQLLGQPKQRLTPDVWIYWQYYSPEKAAEVEGHDTLVVAFEYGQVTGMKLVNGEVLRTRLGKRSPILL